MPVLAALWAGFRWHTVAGVARIFEFGRGSGSSSLAGTHVFCEALVTALTR